MDFMAVGEPRSSSIGLPGIAGGIHYFVVCIHDDGAAVNLISHKYLIEPDVLMGADNFAGFSRDDGTDYTWLMVAKQHSAEDEARLDELRQKMGVYRPPRESIAALRRALPKPPQPGSLAHRFFQEE
jgi:hypothetical protein